MPETALRQATGKSCQDVRALGELGIVELNNMLIGYAWTGEEVVRNAHDRIRTSLEISAVTRSACFGIVVDTRSPVNRPRYVKHRSSV